MSFISGLLAVFGLLMLLMAIVGVIAPSLLKDKKTGEVPKRAEVFAGGMLMAVILLVFAAFLDPTPDPSEEMEAASVVSHDNVSPEEREALHQDLLKELESIRVSDVHENLRIYTQLVELEPTNQEYQARLARYESDVAAELERARLKEERQQQIRRQFSVWNGSHRALERAIKDRMNDPRSFEHVDTVYSDRGDHLMVRTTFRGRNAFGGVVTESVRARVSLDGEVLEIVEEF